MTSPFDNGMTPEQRQSLDRVFNKAVQSWDTALIKSSLQAGGDPQILLREAIERRSAEMVKLSAEYGAKMSTFIEGPSGVFSPAMHAAHKRFDQGVIAQLIANGVDIDQKDKQGKTVAWCAAESGDFEKMSFYVDRGADLSEHVQDILLFGIAKKNKDVVRWALENGADVHATVPEKGETLSVFHYACCKFDKGIAALLLEKGARVGDLSGLGQTPLHAAVDNGDLEQVAFLLEKGVDPLVVDVAGKTVLDFAMDKKEAAKKSVSDRWDSVAQASKTKAEDTASAIITALITEVQKTHSVDPYRAVTQRDIKPVGGGVAFKKKPQEP